MIVNISSVFWSPALLRNIGGVFRLFTFHGNWYQGLFAHAPRSLFINRPGFLGQLFASALDFPRYLPVLIFVNIVVANLTFKKCMKKKRVSACVCVLPFLNYARDQAKK